MKAMQSLWIYYLRFLTSAIWTDSIIPVNNRDIIDAQAGWTFVLRTWSYYGTPLSIKVRKDNITSMDVDYTEYVFNVIEDHADRLVFEYREASKEAYLSFRNISREDHGLYEISESLYDTVSDQFGRKEGKWFLQINVLERDEIKRGNVGDNIIIMEVIKTSESIITLRLYDTIVARFVENGYEITMKSHLYGRLIISNDWDNNNYKIEVKNVTQRDAGLYQVQIEGGETKKCFLNITDEFISASFGDNLTIAWFYNQQGMNRALRVIHPHQGVMMKLTPANVPKIRENFQHRILYSGQIVKSFMSFTLLNIDQSDGGFYSIETLHGNAIPGRKLLIVKAERRNVSSRLNDDAVQASLEVMDYSQPISETIAPSVTSSSTEIPNTLFLVPAYVFPVTIVVFAVMNLTVCFLLWIRRKKSRTIDAERRQVLAKCDTDLYITPIASERPLLMPPNEDVRMDHTNASQNSHVETSMEVLPMDCSPCMDGYEMIRISSNDDFQKTLHNKENNAKSNESSITPFLDASDYLTVEFVMESAV